MSKGGRRSNRAEDKLISRIDRGAYQGPKGSQYDEGEKKRLHECTMGIWIRQVMPGAGNLGPLLRVVDPKGGILENRQGMKVRLSPRAQVIIQP